MRILELFSGYGTASFALKQLGIPYECVGYSDIDKYANQCFRQNHCPVDMDRMLGDVTKIDPSDLEDFDLLTGGFPCQAFSIAGKGLGELDTRGTLFNEIIRIAEVKKPRYMLLENVKGLTNKKHEQIFNKILSELARVGYFIHWGLYNTKEHGIPQNRERVFFICFRDHKEFMSFAPPMKEELKIFLKDILEEDVDEKYYLPENQIKRLLYSDDLKKSFSTLDSDVAGCMTARQYASWRGNFVSIKNATKKGYLEGKEGDGISLEHPDSKTRRGRVQEQIAPTLQCNDAKGVIINPLKDKTNNGWHFEQNVYNKDGIVRSVKAGGGSGNIPKVIIDRSKCTCNEGGECEVCCIGCGSYLDECECEPEFGLTIRKLTPLECFRLQGFLDDDVNVEGISNSQQYKLAGNGQSVNVVRKIFENMFKNVPCTNDKTEKHRVQNCSLNLNKENSE